MEKRHFTVNCPEVSEALWVWGGKPTNPHVQYCFIRTEECFHIFKILSMFARCYWTAGWKWLSRCMDLCMTLILHPPLPQNVTSQRSVALKTEVISKKLWEFSSNAEWWPFPSLVKEQRFMMAPREELWYKVKCLVPQAEQNFCELICNVQSRSIQDRLKKKLFCI